jgi:hypothetical protein
MSAPTMTVLVRYRAGVICGAGFSSVERFEFTGDRISPFGVHFGREVGQHITAPGPGTDSGPRRPTVSRDGQG